MNESQNNRLLIILGVVALVIVILLGWKYFSSAQPSVTENTSVATTTTTTKSEPTSPTQTASTTPLHINTISTTEPALNRPLPNTSQLDPTLVSMTEADMQTAISNLVANKNSFQDWIELGNDRKTLGDYVGAIQAWQYAGVLYPTNIVSFGNLADLYTNFLKNYAQAETNYDIAIQNNPIDVDLYRNLFNLYILENENSNAVATLQKGITVNPNDYTLDILLARYYVTAGNLLQAKIYYNQAITVAQKQGNMAVVNSLQTEEANSK